MKPSTHAKSGLTLVEIIVAMTMAGVISGGILSSLMFVARSGYALQGYFDMNTEGRKALEVFGRDVRMARQVVMGTETSTTQTVTLTVPIIADTSSDGYKDYTVVYTYFKPSATPAARANTFCRRVSASEDTASVPAPNTESALVTNVVSFAFKRYQLSSPIRASVSGTETALPEAANDMETKQLLVSLTTKRTRTSVVKVSDLVVSARYILRNKVVTN